MFLRATILSISCLLLGGFLLAWQLGMISEKDQLAYKELASLSNLNMNARGEPYSAKQERYKVVKEFYLEDEKEEKRLIKLKSRTSSLVYEQKDGGKEIVEKMSDVVCVMQEEVYALLPDGQKTCKEANFGKIMQNVQRIRSSNANYHYQTQILDAENVIVERYTLPGEILPENFEQLDPFFLSTAKHTVFSFNNGITFNAQNIEAAFYQ